MSLQVASLFGVLSLDDSNYRAGLSSARSGLQNLGGQLQGVGAQVAALSAPLAGLFGVATKQAMDFDESVTNTGAVLGLTRDQITQLSSQLLTIGGSTRQGPQAVVDAFYDIAGGVADASTHMAILQASIDTSAAGNANLQGTTQALISTMNSYGFAADKAGFVSDVLTQIVGKGVGTMDQLAGALPNVTGLAASLGIPLDDLGSAMAFLTTKGNSFSEAATMLGADMSALMKPNADMKTALAELGFQSGEAAIKQLGLLGALKAVSQTSTAGSEGMAALLGTQEAVRGSVALLAANFADFDLKFKGTVAGVTDSAKTIQLGSAAAQFDLLKSKISEMSITAGTALLPVLIRIGGKLLPIVGSVIDWIKQNPDLTAQIGMLALGGAALGGALFVVGTVFSGVSAAVGVLSGAISFLLSPVGLLIAGIAGIVYVADQLYPGGIAKLFLDAQKSAQQLAVIGLKALTDAAAWARDRLAELLNTVLGVINKINELKGGLLALPGAASNLGTALSSGASPGQFVQAFVGAVASEGGAYKSAAQKLVAAGLSKGISFPGRAGGGPVGGGMPYLVGERGPEVFTPAVSGTVHSSSDSQRLLGFTMYGDIVIKANSVEEGRAGMSGALELLRARGG